MRIIGIDQGPEVSGYADITPELVVNRVGVYPNTDVLGFLFQLPTFESRKTLLVIEQFVSYGFGVGATTFEAIEWGGRFMQMFINSTGCDVVRMTNRQWALQLTGNQQAKDKQVKEGVLSVFPKDAEKPQKKCGTCKGKGWTGREHLECEECLGSGIGRYDGVLCNAKTHAWDALGLALAGWDRITPGFLEGLR